MVEKIESFQFTRGFRKDYKSLPEKIQSAFDGKLKLLLDNILHPSLRVKRIQGTQDRWEGSVTMKYRFTFQLNENHAIFRAIGTHDILKRN